MNQYSQRENQGHMLLTRTRIVTYIPFLYWEGICNDIRAHVFVPPLYSNKNNYSSYGVIN